MDFENINIFSNMMWSDVGLFLLYAWMAWIAWQSQQVERLPNEERANWAVPGSVGR